MKYNKELFEKKLSIILGECLNFTVHEEKFRPTLNLLLEKANTKLAILHSKINVSTDYFNEKNILSAWQGERENT